MEGGGSSILHHASVQAIRSACLPVISRVTIALREIEESPFRVIIAQSRQSFSFLGGEPLSEQPFTGFFDSHMLLLFVPYIRRISRGDHK